ncbi:hypothetical protein CYMTET_17255, partial [Cymbomonas tetramitiformis]
MSQPFDDDSEIMTEVFTDLSSPEDEVARKAVKRLRSKLSQSGLPEDDDRTSAELTAFQYLRHSPDCADLTALWERFHSTSDSQRKAAPLLALLASLLRCFAGDKIEHRAFKLQLDGLASSMITRRLNALYSHLSSGTRSRINAALALISASSSRSAKLAAEVFSNFDFTLSVLPKLATPPKATEGEDARDVVDRTDLLQLPSRHLFVDLVLSLLQPGERIGNRSTFSNKVLCAGVLHALSQDPPGLQLRVLQRLQRCLLSPDSGIAPRLKTVVLGDSALDQLASISSASKPDAKAAADLSAEILLEVCTNPQHGLCPRSSKLGSVADLVKDSKGGAGRLLRLLQRLRAVDLAPHARIVVAAGRACPPVAAAYLASLPYSLEPRVSARWFGTAALAMNLVPSVQAALAAVLRQHCLQAGASVPDTSLQRTLIRWVVPPALGKAVLGRGIQHPSLLVRLMTLNLLQGVLHCFAALLRDIRCSASGLKPSAAPAGDYPGHDAELPGGALVGGRGVGVDTREWMEFLEAVRQGVRLNLPDAQIILAAHALLHKPAAVPTLVPPVLSEACWKCRAWRSLCKCGNGPDTCRRVRDEGLIGTDTSTVKYGHPLRRIVDGV